MKKQNLWGTDSKHADTHTHTMHTHTQCTHTQTHTHTHTHAPELAPSRTGDNRAV